MKQEGLTVTK